VPPKAVRRNACMALAVVPRKWLPRRGDLFRRNRFHERRAFTWRNTVFPFGWSILSGQAAASLRSSFASVGYDQPRYLAAPGASPIRCAPG
jgi:hypothetical protein